MKHMEITPRRSLSLNLDKTLYIGTSPLRTMWTTQNMKAGIDIPTVGYRMSHSLSMDDTRANPDLQKKDSILKSMIGIFGSLTSIVSRVPNFLSSINNPLSVTIVSNEGIISPEYILKNLTRSSDQSADDMKLFQESSPMYSTKSNIAEIFAEKMPSKNHQMYLDVNNLLPKSWMENFDESNDLDRAIQESLKHMKCQKVNNSESKLESDKSQLNSTTGQVDSAENPEKIEAEIPASTVEPTEDSQMDCDIPLKRPHLQKTRRKNTVARSRGKARSKFQLRKSGVSQSKHRKERTKQNLYSNIHDDLVAWEEDNDSDDANPTDETIQDSYQHIPDYPVFDTFVLSGARTKKRKQRKLSDPDSVKLSLRVRYLPDCSKAEDELSPINCDFRQRIPSESSIDSEDSYCIVFEDGSESEYTDDSDYEDTSDDDVDEEKPGQKVRFNLEPTVHTMIQWNYAYRAARRGPWEEMARDRERFRGRINCIGRVLDPVLTAKHRECIWHDRFALDEKIQT